VVLDSYEDRCSWLQKQERQSGRVCMLSPLEVPKQRLGVLI
jgi:hypothetical protein